MSYAYCMHMSYPPSAAAASQQRPHHCRALPSPARRQHALIQGAARPEHPKPPLRRGARRHHPGPRTRRTLNQTSACARARRVQRSRRAPHRIGGIAHAAASKPLLPSTVTSHEHRQGSRTRARWHNMSVLRNRLAPPAASAHDCHSGRDDATTRCGGGCNLSKARLKTGDWNLEFGIAGALG